MGKGVGMKYSGVWELNLDHAERRNKRNKDEGERRLPRRSAQNGEQKTSPSTAKGMHTLARQGSETAELIRVCLLVKMEKGRCLLQQKFRRKTDGRSIWDSIAPVSALTVRS